MDRNPSLKMKLKITIKYKEATGVGHVCLNILEKLKGLGSRGWRVK